MAEEKTMTIVDSLWNRVESGEVIGDDELQTALLVATEDDNLDAAEATRAMVGFVRSLWANDEPCAELIVGGDGTRALVQIVVAASEENLDVLATGISLDETGVPTPCCSARGKEALTLVASYWCSNPHAPLLVVPDGRPPKRVLGTLQGRPWTSAPMSAAHLGDLRRWAADEPDARVGFTIDAGEN